MKPEDSAGLTGESAPSPCTGVAARRAKRGVTARRAKRSAGGRLQLELGGALAPPLAAAAGVSRAELREPLAALDGLVASLLGDGAPSGFLRVLRRGALFRALGAAAARWRRRRIDDVVHIGIGGSALGAELLFRALSHPLHNALPPRRRRGPRVHFIDNVDPERLAALLEELDPRRSLVHVVSKSGSTVETAAGWQVVRESFERRAQRLRWRDHAVFSAGRGALRELGEREGIEVLEFPEDVGGRFSALTASGLFTPALAGVDVGAVVAGARALLARAAKLPAAENPALVSAALIQTLAAKGRGIQVLMPYADALEPLARWYVQLAAESLGKRRGERGVGVTPLPARGSTDQHSQVQLFVEGPEDKLVTFVRVLRSRPLAIPGGEPAGYLAGVDLGDLLRAEQRGTEVALARAGRPSTSWLLPELAPAPLGALIVALELQVAAQASLLGVNAYDQPGVEAGKVAAFALLGRSGYEAEAKRIARDAPPRWTL
jgi:glucose-6-phosphate isomerase